VSGRPLLVTGAAGFIGARFVERCNQRGRPVVSCDEPAAFARPEHAGLGFGERVDRDALLGWLEASRPELAGIVHLGACTDTTELDRERLHRLNVASSQRLWRSARERGVPFVYASSAATYGDGARGWDDDEARIPELKPLNPYGDSKQQFDLFALESERSGGAPPAWSGFKFFNVYGFGERHKGRMASVVLHAYDQILATGRVKLFRSHRPGVADGEQRRDFVYVADVVDVLEWALARPLARGIYNLGTGAARTFLDLARAVFAALGREPAIDFVDMPPDLRDRYQYFTEATLGRLRAAGYSRPMTPLEQGVRFTVERLVAASREAR
jgi:ADP-L-glycero-D-manno-heptose 6-epimerase